MKAFVDASCVLLGRLLKGDLVTWTQAKEQAQAMNDAQRDFKPSEGLSDSAGGTINVKPPLSPSGFLIDSLLDFSTYCLAAYVVLQIFGALLAILPYVLMLLVALAIGSMFIVKT